LVEHSLPAVLQDPFNGVQVVPPHLPLQQVAPPPLSEVQPLPSEMHCAALQKPFAPQLSEQQSVGAEHGIPSAKHFPTVEPQAWVRASQMPEQHVAPLVQGSLKMPHETVPSDAGPSVGVDASAPAEPPPPAEPPALPPEPPPPPEPPADTSGEPSGAEPSVLAPPELPPAAPPAPLAVPPLPEEPPRPVPTLPLAPPRPPFDAPADASLPTPAAPPKMGPTASSPPHPIPTAAKKIPAPKNLASLMSDDLRARATTPRVRHLTPASRITARRS
jgi:hypothetical protein